MALLLLVASASAFAPSAHVAVARPRPTPTAAPCMLELRRPRLPAALSKLLARRSRPHPSAEGDGDGAKQQAEESPKRAWYRRLFSRLLTPLRRWRQRWLGGRGEGRQAVGSGMVEPPPQWQRQPQQDAQGPTADAPPTAPTSTFYPFLPRVTSRGIPRVLERLGDGATPLHFECVLDGKVQLSLKRIHATRFVAAGQRVPCWSLINIEVDPEHRRGGLGRRAVRTLASAAAANRHAIIIEDVVSEPMHRIVAGLNGEHLPGSRPGANGCHYTVTPRKKWEGLATG